MRSAKVVAIALMGAALAGCASERFADAPKEGTGTVVGALAGAAVGSQIGGSTRSRVAAGVAGAVIGGMVGNRIGAALDDEDRARAYEAQMAALDGGAPGAPVGWENPDSGRRGSIVPGPYYERRGTRCRDYTHTIYIDGRPQIARGQACRNPDGSWQPVT